LESLNPSLEDSKPTLRRQGPPPGTVAARIFELRRAGETDAVFARRIGLKSQQALHEMAKGKGGVSSQVLAEIVQRTGIDATYLLLGVGLHDVKTADRARLEEIAAILQKAGVIPPEGLRPIDGGAVDRAKKQVGRLRTVKDTPPAKEKKRRVPGR
jgi:hypothetical protein